MLKNFKTKEQAFTLIELLVVIGIIGLIAGIILVGVKSALDRAKNSSVEADCYQIRIKAAQIFAVDESYTSLCDDDEDILNESIPELKILVAAIKKNNNNQNPSCYTTGSTYCVGAPLLTNETHCVDYRGYAGREKSTCDVGAECY